MKRNIMLSLSKPSSLLVDLPEFEEKIGYKLPQDYIEFLKRMNGGVPDLDVGFMLGTEFVSFMRFIPFTGLDQVDHGLEYEYQIFREEMEESDLLPIAFDIGHNPICMSISKESGYGMVVSIVEVEQGHKIVKLGESFTEFWDELVVEKNDNPE